MCLDKGGFKKFIREDFDANPNSFAIANKSHVTFNTQHSIKQTIVENLVVRVKRGPEATLDYNVVITCATPILVPLSIL